MISKRKRIAAVSAAIFLVMTLASWIADQTMRDIRTGGAVMAFTGITAFVSYLFTCRAYAVAKGYSGECGLGLSLLIPVGVLILFLLKDRSTALNRGGANHDSINFETGSTQVDERTQARIATLAQFLADPKRKDKKYKFIGHTDTGGIEMSNVPLSTRRAEAVYQSVVLLEPSLEDRIQVYGNGSTEPIDLGNTEEAHRRNRRLQVLLE
jgi:hypothetical protein